MIRYALLLLGALLVLAACEGGETAGGGGADGQEAVAAARQGAGGQAPAADGVTVTGEGRVAGRPDTLRATVGVHVVRPDVDEAFADAGAAADRVLAAVREHGVEDEDIQTREFSVRPRQEHRPDGPPEVTGYVVRNLVEITVRDLDTTGELLAAVADAAGDDARIQGLRFSLEDNAAQLEGARERAFEDARAKAEHYASLAGRDLGELVSVTEVGAQRPPPVAFEETATDAARAVPIEPGQQEVGVRLQATWNLD